MVSSEGAMGEYDPTTAPLAPPPAVEATAVVVVLVLIAMFGVVLVEGDGRWSR